RHREMRLSRAWTHERLARHHGSDIRRRPRKRWIRRSDNAHIHLLQVAHTGRGLVALDELAILYILLREFLKQLFEYGHRLV
ncbi:hypothetical protein PMAYCL1PPCAC_13275, partial [Pristionchus mayeri]